MSKFLDLLEGKMSEYPPFIIPVESLCEMGAIDEKGNTVFVNCRRLASEKEILKYAIENGHNARRVAVGYPLYDDGWWQYKVWTR